jgi:hypothetical protein
MFDLMLGRDAVQRQMQESFTSQGPRAPKGGRRWLPAMRVTAASALRALADQLEPSRPAAASEPAVGTGRG